MIPRTCERQPAVEDAWAPGYSASFPDAAPAPYQLCIRCVMIAYSRDPLAETAWWFGSSPVLWHSSPWCAVAAATRRRVGGSQLPIAGAVMRRARAPTGQDVRCQSAGELGRWPLDLTAVVADGTSGQTEPNVYLPLTATSAVPAITTAPNVPSKLQVIAVEGTVAGLMTSNSVTSPPTVVVPVRR